MVIHRVICTLFFRLLLIILIAGGVFLVEGWTDAHAQDCDTVLSNPFTNCGFETGGFAGWVTQDLTDPFFPLLVGGAGLGPGFGFFTSDPTQGVFAALNGFDGNGPGTIRIAQDVVLHPGSEQLVFDYRCAWDFGPGDPATLDRTFSVNIEESGGGALLQSDLILTAVAGTTAIPDSGGNLTGVVDLTAVAGQAVRVSFDWFIPEDFTGPGFCQLDNVLVTRGEFISNVPTLSEWGLIAMAGVLGIVGLLAVRKRQVTA